MCSFFVLQLTSSMSASSSGVGVNSASAAAGGYSAGGVSNSGDVVRNIGQTVARGGQGKSLDGAGGGTGKGVTLGKKRVASKEVMPKNVPDKLSKRIPPQFQDTKGRTGSVKTSGDRLAKGNERDRDPDVQPTKRDVVTKGAPQIQIENRLSHTRVKPAQKLCTFGSHRRFENWTHGYKQQTKGPFSDHLPFRTRNDMTPSGVGSNLGI